MLNFDGGSVITYLKSRFRNQFEQFDQEALISELNNFLPPVLSNIVMSYHTEETDRVMNHLQKYLEEQFSDTLLSDPTLLSALSSKARNPYYDNLYHTAWRYLFANPNPFLHRYAPDSYKIISKEHKELIAYLWVAIHHLPVQEFPAGFTRESVKELFILTLSDIARALTTNENRLDFPSCPAGIPPRLFSFLQLILPQLQKQQIAEEEISDEEDSLKESVRKKRKLF